MSFAYIGNKRKQLPYLPVYRNAKLIVEPFAGSAAYSIRNYANPPLSAIPWYCADVDVDVRMLHLYLRRVSVQRLLWLNSLTWNKGEDLHQYAIRMGLSIEEKYFMAISIGGLYAGAAAYKMYDLHKLNIDKNLLPFVHRFRALAGVHADFRDTLRYAKPGSVFFIDPPYLETAPRYSTAVDTLEPKDIAAFVMRAAVMGATVIFTYGNFAQTYYPQFNWIPIHHRSVSAARDKTGIHRSVSRVEHVAIMNFTGLT